MRYGGYRSNITFALGIVALAVLWIISSFSSPAYGNFLRGTLRANFSAHFFGSSINTSSRWNSSAAFVNGAIIRTFLLEDYSLDNIMVVNSNSTGSARLEIRQGDVYKMIDI